MKEDVELAFCVSVALFHIPWSSCRFWFWNDIESVMKTYIIIHKSVAELCREMFDNGPAALRMYGDYAVCSKIDSSLLYNPVKQWSKQLECRWPTGCDWDAWWIKRSAYRARLITMLCNETSPRIYEKSTEAKIKFNGASKWLLGIRVFLASCLVYL